MFYPPDLARVNIERSLLDRNRDRPLPWGGAAVSVAARLAARGDSGRVVPRRATPLDCILQEEDIDGYSFDHEDDLESTLVRESYKHGVLVNSTKFFSYASKEARARARRLRPRWRSLFDPSSRFQLSWNILIVIVTSVMCIAEPLAIGFDVPMRVGAGMNPYAVLDFIAGLVYALDTFCVNFLEAKIITCRSTGRRKLITTPALIHAIYVVDGTFAQDVIVCVPFVVQLIASVRRASTTSERFTRILRLLRVGKFIGASLTMPEILFMKVFRATPLVVFMSQTILAFLLLVHCVACVYILVAIKEGLENSWVAQIDLEVASDTKLYIGALYFATATITTVGFGDVSAGATAVERITVSIGMVMGACFYAYLVGSMASSIENLSLKISRQRKSRVRLTRVHAFLDRLHAPRITRAHVMSYVSEVEVRKTCLRENEEIMISLPTDLREAMTLHMLSPSVRKIFGPMSNGTCARIASVFDIVVVDPGEEIEAGFFYIVTEGVIAVSHLDEHRLSAVLTGASTDASAAYLSYFGLDVLISAERRADIRASSLTVCELWRASENSVRTLLTNHPNVPQFMLESLRAVQEDDFADLLQRRVETLETFVASLRRRP